MPFGEEVRRCLEVVMKWQGVETEAKHGGALTH